MRGTTTNVLVAERDPDLARTVTLDLTADGHSIQRVTTEDQLLAVLAEQPPHIILLGTIDAEPVETVLHLRSDRLATRTSRMGIIVLCSAVEDLAGPRLLRAGADDVIATPADPMMLSARVTALARRLRLASVRPNRVRIGALEVDAHRRDVHVRGRRVRLTGREFDLLRWLAADPTKVHTKTELLRGIWGYPDGVCSRTVDSHAARLRRKLTEAGAPGRVVTVWGIGYRLIDADVEAMHDGAA